MALAGLKLEGYRSRDGEGNRQTALGVVEQTLALKRGAAAAFVEANRIRINTLYHGHEVEVPDSTLEALQAGVREGIAELRTRIRSRFRNAEAPKRKP